MSQLLEHMLPFLVTPPGNFAYHLVLVLFTAGTLVAGFQLIQAEQYRHLQRSVIGLGVLLGLQILFILAGYLARLGVLDGALVLPALDRAVTFLMLIWITWLWAFPERSRRADFAVLLLTVLGLAMLGFTLAFWTQNSSAQFQDSLFELIWQAASLGMAVFGLMLLVVRQPNGWGNGLAMLLLAALGHLFSLIMPSGGDFPGYVRLVQVAMFAILPTLVLRTTATGPERKTVPGRGRLPGGALQERRRYSTDPRTLHALLALAGENDAAGITKELTKGIAQAMLADLCMLVVMDSDKNLSVASGYDLVREENLAGTEAIQVNIPALVNAIGRGRPLRIPAKNASAELKSLVQSLNLSTTGSLLSIPIASRETGPLGAILLLSPHSDREWNSEDQSLLSKISPLLVPILARSQRLEVLEAGHSQATLEMYTAQEQARQAGEKLQQAMLELDQSHAQAGQVTSLLAMQEEAEKTIEGLKKQAEELRRAADETAWQVEKEQLELDLRQALQEMARMQNAAANSDGKMLELEQRKTPPISNDQVEVIASISKELRQPMSSIIGYTDLLLGESVGQLGAMQRKFVERIKASTERAGGLADDLVQITNLDSGKLEFKSESIDLNLIIDNAMAYTSTQIREKNITMRLDIPENPPPIKSDRDALQQIFIHLLQNATAASQMEGVIILRVQLQNEGDQHFISIQVSDSGGGIASEDLPRVFDRRFRGEPALIQGVGDTGVGLSIAKSLVEFQNGRIWVDTEAGVGSTISVLLPVLLEAEEA